MDCAFAAQHPQHQNPKDLLKGFVQTVKANKEMKRKVRRKTSTSKVSSFLKTGLEEVFLSIKTFISIVYKSNNYADDL